MKLFLGVTTCIFSICWIINVLLLIQSERKPPSKEAYAIAGLFNAVMGFWAFYLFLKITSGISQ